MKATLTGLLSMALAVNAAAQSGPLQPVVARVPIGTRIRIQATDGRELRGLLYEARPDVLLLDDGASGLAVRYGGVTRFWTRERATIPGAIIGGSAGAVGGIFLGLLATALCEYDCHSSDRAAAAGALIVGAAGAATGAIIGAAIPRWRLRWRGVPTDTLPGYGGCEDGCVAYPRRERRIGELGLLAVAGAGSNVELGAAASLGFRAGGLALGPELMLLAGARRVRSLGLLTRANVAASGGRAVYLVGGVGGSTWTDGITEAGFLTVTIGAGADLPDGWRAEARWHPSPADEVGTVTPRLFTIGVGRRLAW